MPRPADAKLNQLLDQMEQGQIDVLDFLDDVSGTPDYLAGLGPFVKPSAQGPTAAPKGKFVKTGVVLRVKAVDPNGDNHIEGAVRPGAAPLIQIMKRGAWHHRVANGAAELVIAGARKKLKKGDAVTVKSGEPLELQNPGQQPWEFSATHSAWHPDLFVYEFRNQKYTGEQLWFAIRPDINDQDDRPIYNVRSSTSGTFAVVKVDPKQTTLPAFYTDGDNIVTLLVGQGDLLIGKGPQKQKIDMKRGKSHTVPKGEAFTLHNDGRFPMLAEVRPDQPRMWDPKTSFWDTGNGNFVTGDVVFFEYVIPTG